MDPLSTGLWVVGVVYGSYALLSLCFSCIVYAVLVLPILRHSGRGQGVRPWRDACVWGFFYVWMYIFSMILLLPYRLFFGLIQMLFCVDLRSYAIWSEKEKKFFYATPRSFFEDLVQDYFAKYYPPVPPSEFSCE